MSKPKGFSFRIWSQRRNFAKRCLSAVHAHLYRYAYDEVTTPEEQLLIQDAVKNIYWVLNRWDNSNERSKAVYLRRGGH